MALLEKHLFVKTSTIPNAGKGLFTKIFIPKGTRIVEYKGRRTIWKDVKNNHENGYLYTINNNNVIDAGKTLSALARYANDAKGITRVKGINNNCVYVNDNLRAYIESTKDIPAGGEILVDYTKEYWDVMRVNIREREKEKAAVNGSAVKKSPTKKKMVRKKTTVRNSK